MLNWQYCKNLKTVYIWKARTSKKTPNSKMFKNSFTCGKNENNITNYKPKCSFFILLLRKYMPIDRLMFNIWIIYFLMYAISMVKVWNFSISKKKKNMYAFQNFPMNEHTNTKKSNYLHVSNYRIVKLTSFHLMMKISSIVQYNADLKEDTLADSTRILFLKNWHYSRCLKINY